MKNPTRLISRPAAGVLLALSVFAILNFSARAATLSWSSSGNSTLGGTGTWDTSSALWWDGVSSAVAWTDTTGTADTAVFGGTAGTVTLGSSLGALGLQFSTTGYTLATGSNTLTLGTGGIDASVLTSGTTTITGNLSLVGAQSWNNGSGSTLTASAAIATGGNALTIASAGTTTLSGVLSGTGSLIKSGSGTTTLSAANTYSGGTSISAGTVLLGNSSALGTGSVTMTGGTLRNTTGITTTNNVAINGAVTLDASGGNWNFNGNLTGSGAITRGTNATTSLYLGGDNSGYTGTFTIANNGNAVVRFSAATAGSANAQWVDNQGTNTRASLDFAGGTIKFGSLTGTGFLTNQGNGANTIEVGALGLSNSFTGVINSSTGTLNVTKVGTGAWTLTGANSYGGTTTIQNGSLVAGANASVSASGAFGNASSAIALGDATSINSNLSPSLLTGGAFTVARAITVGSSNTATTGVYTIGGNTANASTFSGTTTLNQNLSVTQVSGGTLTVSGNTTSGSSGTQTLTFNNTGSVTDSAVIGGGTGAIALTQAGSGTTTLTGINTYTGATTITGGTLTISGTGSINSSSGITINGSSAKFVQASSVASTPAITVTQGTLDGTGTVGAVTMGNGTGAILANGNGNTTTKLTLGSLTFTGGASTINLRFDGTLGFAVSNALITAGTITVNNSNGFSWANGSTYNIISYGSGSSVSTSNFTTTGLGLTSRQSATWGSNGSFLTLAIAGDSPKWTGLDSGNWQVGSTGGSSNWKLITAGTATNFAANDTVLFDDTATGTTIVDISNGNVSTSGVTFNNSTQDYTVTGSNGVITGSGGLTKNGPGTLTIMTANTYTGATTINAGTVSTGVANALGSGSALTMAAGSTLNLNSNNTAVGSLAGNGTINLDNAVLSTGSDNTSTTFAGVIADGGNGGGITKNGTGTLTLTGTNTYTGATMISGGTLALGGSGQLGGGAYAGNIANTGALIDNSSATQILSGTISGTGGTVSQTGSGALTLSGANTYTGGTTLSAGTLNLNSAAAIGTGALTINGGTLDNTSGGALTLSGNNTQSWSGDFAFTGTNNLNLGAGAVTLGANRTVTVNGGTLTVGGAISGSGLSLAKAGTGTLTLGGTSTYTGGTTVNAGTLTLSSGSGSGTIRGTLTINSGATVNLTAQDALGYSAGLRVDTVNINGGTLNNAVNANNGFATNFVLTGGTMAETVATTGVAGYNFDAANGYGITTNASATTSTISARLTIRTGTLGFNVADGAAATDLAVSGVILSNGGTAISKSGAGTMVLTGANTYTGATTVNAGTLQIGNGSTGSIATTGGVTVVSGATLGLNLAASGTFANTIANSGIVVANGGNANTISGVISGSGAFTQSGSGATTLTGSNTYTGTTTVNAGTLALGASNVIASSSGLILNGGTFATGGFNQTLNTLTLSSSSILDFGSGTSALAFADSSSITWTGILTLLNFDVGVDTLKFGTSSTSLTATQLSQLSLAGYTIAGLDSNGFLQVSAIPEPATYAALLGSLALVGAAIIRRRRTAPSA